MAIQVRSNGPQEATQAPMSQLAEGKEESKSAPETNGSEQNDAVESDTTEEEAKEEVKDEADESESGDDEEKSDESAKDKPKAKKGGFQRRIDKLNAAKAAAQQEAEYWKSLALKQSAGESKAEAKVEPVKTEEVGRPKADDFETHAEYVEALTDWKIEQREKARKAEEQKSKLQSEQEKAMSAHRERVKSFADKTEDFMDVIEAVDDIPVSAALQEIIVSSENGPELMYELAKNREEYERIAKLSPLAVARELGKLEVKLAARASEQKAEPKKLTKAPQPIEPVGSGGAGKVRKSITDPDISQAEYERLRREQLKRRQA